MIYITEVTPSQDKSQPGKNKTVGLNYEGPGMNHSHCESFPTLQMFFFLDPLLLQPEVSSSSDHPSTLYMVALILVFTSKLISC